jgi:hypothetical protein
MFVSVPTYAHRIRTILCRVATLEKQVNWNGVMQSYLGWTRIGRGPQASSVTSQEHSVTSAEQPVLDPDQPPGERAADLLTTADSRTMQSAPAAGQQVPAAANKRADNRSSERVRSWRRRVLLRRGARMHAVMGTDVENCSLAMLDEEGVVVSWYGRADGNDRGADHVVDHHVSQFYVPEDIARKQPLLDLHAATVEGSDTGQGWRRRPDGIAFWGTTVIEAVLLRDGRLQGFSYVTRGAEGPPTQLPSAEGLDLPRGEAASDWNAGMRGVGILPPRDRIARSRSAARQRRLFRLACRMGMPEAELAAPRAPGIML